MEFNPARLDFVNERLNLIYSLQQKHRVQSVEELIELTESYRSQLNAITSFDDRIAELEGEKKKLYAEVLRQAEKLTRFVHSRHGTLNRRWNPCSFHWVCLTCVLPWN